MFVDFPNVARNNCIPVFSKLLGFLSNLVTSLLTIDKFLCKLKNVSWFELTQQFGSLIWFKVACFFALYFASRGIVVIKVFLQLYFMAKGLKVFQKLLFQKFIHCGTEN